jgi:hypothetical protein
LKETLLKEREARRKAEMDTIEAMGRQEQAEKKVKFLESELTHYLELYLKVATRNLELKQQ